MHMPSLGGMLSPLICDGPYHFQLAFRNELRFRFARSLAHPSGRPFVYHIIQTWIFGGWRAIDAVHRRCLGCVLDRVAQETKRVRVRVFDSSPESHANTLQPIFVDFEQPSTVVVLPVDRVCSGQFDDIFHHGPAILETQSIRNHSLCELRVSSFFQLRIVPFVYYYDPIPSAPSTGMVVTTETYPNRFSSVALYHWCFLNNLLINLTFIICVVCVCSADGWMYSN